VELAATRMPTVADTLRSNAQGIALALWDRLKPRRAPDAAKAAPARGKGRVGCWRR